MYQNVWNTTKAVLRRKFLVKNIKKNLKSISIYTLRTIKEKNKLNLKKKKENKNQSGNQWDRKNR